MRVTATARTARMAITTRSSMRVKALVFIPKYLNNGGVEHPLYWFLYVVSCGF
jgi:hypothetical protein